MLNEEDKSKKFSGLKVAKNALGVLSTALALIPNPITNGISVGAGLGAIAAEAFIDSKENNNNLVPVR